MKHKQLSISNHQLKRLIIGTASLVLAVIIAAATLYIFSVRETEAAWYNNNWHFRKKLTIDNTKVSGSADLTNFPILVSLQDNDLTTNAQTDGDDIVFTQSDGSTLLSHEIESYSNGTLVAWVKIPTLSYNTDTVIYMYYGNATTAATEDPTNVWDSNYKGVWHLGESATDEQSSTTFSDSTSNGNNGTQAGNASTTGKIGSSQDFDGADDYIIVADSASLDISGDYTVSLWAKPNGGFGTTNDYVEGLADKGAYNMFFDKSDGKVHAEVNNGNTTWTTSDNTSNYTVGALGVYNGNLYSGSDAGSDSEMRQYNGTSWSSSHTATGYSKPPASMAVFNGNLYAGMNGISAGDGDILVFNGSSWSTNYNQSTYESTTSLEPLNGKLYAGTSYSIGSDVLVYDNSSWTTSFNGPENSVNSLGIYKGQLYAGLGFNQDDNDIYVFDGSSSWSLNVAGSVDTAPSLSYYNQKFYAGMGGNINGDGDIYEYDGSSWSLSQNNGGFIQTTNALTAYNGKLYAGLSSGSSGGQGDILVYDGSSWTTAYDGLQEAIPALAVYKGDLYAGQGNGSGDGDVLVLDAGDSVETTTTSWNDAFSYITITKSGTTLSMYVNGSLEATTTAASSTVDTNGLAFLIGQLYGSRGPGTGTGHFQGVIDELELSNTPRSSDWIATEYNNQSNPTTFLSVQSQEVKDDPVAHWSFDEGYGTTVNDSSPNGSNGTMYNSPTWIDEGRCVFGKCLQFDGSNDYVNSSYAPNLGTSDFTIGMWARFGSQSGYAQLLASTAETGAQDELIELSVDNGTGNCSANQYTFVVIDTDSSNGNQVCSTSTFNDSQWHYLSVVFDNTNSLIHFYADGVLESSTTITTESSGNKDFTGYPWFIGGKNNRGTPEEYFNGFIDDVKIYNYARTAAQIKADYNSRGAVKGVSARFGEGNEWMSDGLVGYWNMEGIGSSSPGQTVTDLSGNSNNGTTYDTDLTLDCTLAGKFGNGCDFDGVDDYISTANIDVSSAMTLSVWVNADGNINGNGVVTQYDGSDSNKVSYSLVQTGSSYKFIIKEESNGVQESIFASQTVSDNAWHHIVGVFSAKDKILQIFVDGQLDTQQGSSVSAIQNTTTVTSIGADYDAGYYRFYDGTIDDVRIYNRALSPGEVVKLYKWAPSPVAYYNFDEGSGTSLQDRSGNGNTGTLGYDGAGTDIPTWGTGKYGGGLNFGGNGNYDNVNIPTAISSGWHAGQPFTVEAWINNYAVDGANIQCIVCFDADRFRMALNPTGTFNLVLTGTTSLVTANTIPLNTWTHVTGVYDGSLKYAYINGSLVKTDDSGATSNAIGSPINIIGASYFSADPGQPWREFNGQIDDVRIYNYARTAEQIAEDMNAGHPAVGTPIGSAVLDLSFDEGYGQTVHDKSPQGNNGTRGANSSSASDDPTWTNDGKFGKALSFDGAGTADDVVTVPAASSINTMPGFTLSTWIYPTGSGENTAGGIVYKRITASAAGWKTNIVDSNYGLGFYVEMATTDLVVATADNAVTPNTWQHVVYVWDGSTTAADVGIYVNGIKKTHKTNTNGSGAQVDDSAINLLIGNNNAGAVTFDGYIDNVQIYPFAATSDQVKILYNQGKSEVLGSLSQNTSSVGQNSASSSYCPPGNTDSCTAPVFEMNFENSSGTTYYDTSTGGNDGTAYNGPILRTPADCKVGNCLEFDGVDDSVKITDPASGILDFGTSTDFSLGAWIKTTQSTEGDFFTKYNGGTTPGWGIVVIGSNASAFIRDGVGTPNGPDELQTVTGTSNVADNNWHFIETTFDRNGNMLLYVDGILEGTQDISTITDTVSNSIDVYIGRAANTTPGFEWFYDGEIDQVKIYNYVRTPAQIAWDYNKGGPVAWYKFDECSGTTANDASGNGYTGTIYPRSLGNTSVGTCNSGNGNEMWDNGTTGKRNASLDFDGLDDYVSVSDNDNLTFGKTTSDKPFSVSVWAKLGTGSAGDFVSKYNINIPAIEYRFLYGNTKTTLSFLLYDDSTNGRIGRVGTISDATNWHMYTATYDGTAAASGIKLYRDGVRIDDANDSAGGYTAMENTTADVLIGAHSNTGSETDGQIDDARIYNYTLTAQQVKLIFNNGSANFQ